MAEFTQKDRDFLVKAMKEFGKLDGRVKVLEAAKKAETLPRPVAADGFNFEPEDSFYEESDFRAISLTFKTPTDEKNRRPREILTHTIYKAIQELCIVNGIDSIALTIENV